MKALPVPKRMQRLPRDAAGRVVPWFVVWLDEDGQPVPAGTPTAKPDFRVLKPGAVSAAVQQSLCFLCGQHLSARKTFPLGPMCCITRTTAEPPSHFECAEYAVKVCPFLSKPKMERSARPKPADTQEPAGDMIPRNPGVVALWTTRSFSPFNDGKGGTLFHVGDPERLEFWAEGRFARPSELADSIRGGLPFLFEAARLDGEVGVRALLAAIMGFCRLVPGLVPEKLLPDSVIMERTA